MRFGLQIGAGMQGLAREFLKHQSTRNPVILSPRNAGKKAPVSSLASFASTIAPDTNEVLVDPQLYFQGTPKGALGLFPHYKAAGENLQANLEAALAALRALNDECQTTRFIVPANYQEQLSSDYLDDLGLFAQTARHYATGRQTLLTLALGPDCLKARESVDMLHGALADADCEGVYIVAAHPDKSYLPDDPNWLVNLMSLIAGIKQMGKLVYVGYENHIAMILAMTGCDVIFSGNYLNTRHFQQSAFEETGDNFGRQAIWYYAPQTLSEYRLNSLDLARNQGVLYLMEPSPRNNYTKVLFNPQVMPSDTAYNQKDSFLHYLTSVNQQVITLNQNTYQDTHNALENLYTTAESSIEGLHKKGIYDQSRSGATAVTATLQAMTVIDNTWGFILSHNW